MSWYGVLAPAGTSAPIVARLASEITKVLGTEEVRARVASEGGEILGESSARFAAFLVSERAKWGTAVNESGAKVD